MSWGQFARATNPKTCWHCEHFDEIGGCQKFVCKNFRDTKEFIDTEIAKQKCVYEKKQAKYPDKYPNPYKPYGWLKNARKEHKI